jgi:hypothetical protein
VLAEDAVKAAIKDYLSKNADGSSGSAPEHFDLDVKKA